MVPTGKVLWTLDLINYITLRTSNIEWGEVVLYADNKKILNKYAK